MTWRDMHVGIDVGLRLIQSNLYNKLLNEEKDFILNRIITNMILDEVGAQKPPIENMTYDDIRKWYVVTNPLIRDLSFKEFITGNGYIEIALPKNTTAPISSGNLIAGRSYKIVTPGATVLSSFGISTNLPNKVFTYNPANVEFEVESPNYALTILEGYKYEILVADGISFTPYGAASNDVGTIFTATEDHTFSSATDKNTVLRVISGLPEWDGVTTVLPINSEDVLHLISSTSRIATNCILNSGTLTKGNYYKVINAGTISNLTLFGSTFNTVEKGYIFLCTTTGVPNWATSNVQLAEYRTSINRLVIASDVDNFLNHSYGTVISSPICIMINNNLRVYHNNKFEIEEVIVRYLRPPAKIDSNANIDCDLDLLVQDIIVDKAVSYIAATFSSPAYQALKNEQ